MRKHRARSVRIYIIGNFTRIVYKCLHMNWRRNKNELINDVLE